MRKISVLLVAALAVLMAVSCTSLKLEGLTIPVNEAEGSVIGDLDVTVQVKRLLAGPFSGIRYFNTNLNIGNAGDEAIIQAVKDAVTVAGGSAAINVTVDYGAQGLSMALGYLTSGIYSPVDVHVTGQIIR
jgi:hypothetical protein